MIFVDFSDTTKKISLSDFFQNPKIRIDYCCHSVGLQGAETTFSEASLFFPSDVMSLIPIENRGLGGPKPVGTIQFGPPTFEKTHFFVTPKV